MHNVQVSKGVLQYVQMWSACKYCSLLSALLYTELHYTCTEGFIINYARYVEHIGLIHAAHTVPQESRQRLVEDLPFHILPSPTQSSCNMPAPLLINRHMATLNMHVRHQSKKSLCCVIYLQLYMRMPDSNIPLQ